MPQRRRIAVALVLGAALVSGVSVAVVLQAPPQVHAHAEAPGCRGEYEPGPPDGDAVQLTVSGWPGNVTVSAWARGHAVWNTSTEGPWVVGDFEGLAHVICQFIPGGGADSFYVWRGNASVVVAKTTDEIARTLKDRLEAAS